MKKIINGKIYDTDTARHVAFAAGGDGFSSWQEDLYQKRTGEYFIHGKGGPMTKYAHYVDGNNMWSEGEKIIPMGAEKARTWAEEHLEADEYAEIFGMPDEGEGKAALCIQIDAALMARLRAMAAEDGISLTACVEDILRKTLN